MAGRAGRWAAGCAGGGPQLLPLRFPQLQGPAATGSPSHHRWPGCSPSGSSPTAGNHNGFNPGIASAAKQERRQRSSSLPGRKKAAGRDGSSTQGRPPKPLRQLRHLLWHFLGESKADGELPAGKELPVLSFAGTGRGKQHRQAACPLVPERSTSYTLVRGSPSQEQEGQRTGKGEKGYGEQCCKGVRANGARWDFP